MQAALLALVLAAASLVPITGTSIPVTVRTIEQFEDNGTRTHFGRVEYLGGIVVSSSEKTFGGLSGIAVLPGGRDAVIVSDLGYLMLARLQYQGARLSGISIPHLMLALPRAAKDSKRSDIEDLAIGANEIIVALEEDDNQIAILPFDNNVFGAARLLALPGAVRLLGINKGIESIAIIPRSSDLAGHVLAIAERPTWRSGDKIPCWILTVGTCSVRKRDGFEVTAARFLPGGDLLILERKFAPGFNLAMRLRRIPADQIGVGRVMDGEIILEAGLSMQIDNMEGLAIHQDDAGRTIITLLSDNNRNFFQRTLILQFALVE